jgi:hypothetical protein
MPLSLGVDTELPELVTWDPEDPRQAEEAEQHIQSLWMEGYQTQSTEPGQVRLSPPKRKASEGLLRVLTDNGDDRIVWDRNDAAQVREAHEDFAKYVGQNYRAYTVLDDGSRGHEIDTFDPSASEILLVPGGHLMPG